MFENWKPAEIATIFATLVGPILAVQAQRLVDLIRQKHEIRSRIFGTLMNTRAMPVSGQHVEALNAIPVAFDPQWWERFGRRDRLKVVDEKWRQLLHHFNVDQSKFTEAQTVNWIERRVTFDTEVIEAIGKCLGYRLSALDYQSQFYFPVAHGNEMEQNGKIREGLAAVLSGERGIRIDAPVDDQSKAMRQAMANILQGQAPIRVALNPGPGQQQPGIQVPSENPPNG